MAELIDTDVTRPPRLHQQSGELRISYIRNANRGSSVGELWSKLGDEDPVFIADGGKLDLLALWGDGLRVVVDWNGTTGTLLHWEDGNTSEILDEVVEINSLGVLADYDGRTGSLYLLDGLEPTFIAEGVPRGGRRDNAFLMNYEGVTGDLVLLDEETLELTEVGTGVGKDGFGFAVQFNAMVYLAERNPDDGTSTLKLTFFDTGDVFAISSGVTESREVAIPKPGILYAIGQDDRAGIWFAEAR